MLPARAAVSVVILVRQEINVGSEQHIKRVVDTYSLFIQQRAVPLVSASGRLRNLDV